MASTQPIRIEPWKPDSAAFDNDVEMLGDVLQRSSAEHHDSRWVVVGKLCVSSAEHLDPLPGCAVHKTAASRQGCGIALW
jgi:hypothetical protein